MSQQQQQKPPEDPGAAASVDAPNAAPGGADAPDVSRQIAALTEAVNQLVRAQHPQRQSPQRPSDPPEAAATAARERYVREHLGDLPEVYRRQMPDVGDLRELADAEAAIRRQFREDLRATFAGAAAGPPDVGGDIAGAGGHAVVGAAVDPARLSPEQQIALGLRGAAPVGPARPEGAPPARPRGAGGAPPREADAAEQGGAPAGAD